MNNIRLVLLWAIVAVTLPMVLDGGLPFKKTKEEREKHDEKQVEKLKAAVLPYKKALSSLKSINDRKKKVCVFRVEDILEAYWNGGQKDACMDYFLFERVKKMMECDLNSLTNVYNVGYISSYTVKDDESRAKCLERIGEAYADYKELEKLKGDLTDEEVDKTLRSIKNPARVELGLMLVFKILEQADLDGSEEDHCQYDQIKSFRQNNNYLKGSHREISSLLKYFNDRLVRLLSVCADKFPKLDERNKQLEILDAYYGSAEEYEELLLGTIEDKRNFIVGKKDKSGQIKVSVQDVLDEFGKAVSWTEADCKEDNLSERHIYRDHLIYLINLRKFVYDRFLNLYDFCLKNYPHLLAANIREARLKKYLAERNELMNSMNTGLRSSPWFALAF